MPASEEQSNGQQKNTYVVDAESAAEMARLIQQDHLITRAMGGILPEIDLSGVQRVLDLACGPGGWALELAHTYSDMEVAGVDISERMIAYANTRAQVQQRSNISFGVMDILKPLDFPDAIFDLVNARFISGFMLRDAWPLLFRQIMRVLRPGGIMRLTEFEQGWSNKPHFEKMIRMTLHGIHRVGMNFSPNGYYHGIIHMLPSLFRQAGLSVLGTKAHFLDCSFGTEAHNVYYHDVATGLQLAEPLIVKTQLATAEEWRELLQKGLTEMLEEDFCAAWILVTTWGEKPL